MTRLFNGTIGTLSAWMVASARPLEIVIVCEVVVSQSAVSDGAFRASGTMDLSGVELQWPSVSRGVTDQPLEGGL